MDVLSIAKDTLHRAGIAFKSLSVIAMNRSGATYTSVTLLIFVDQEKDPLVIMKITPSLEIAKSLEQEFKNLSFLYHHGSPQFIKTIPEPLYFGKFNNLTIFAEMAKPGKPMKNFPPDRYFSSKRFELHFANVVQWLYEFHQCMADNQTIPVSLDTKNTLTNPIEEYRHSFRLSARLDYLLDETIECIKQANIPTTPWHRDFCTENILVLNEQQISVIDWEYPLVNSWPLSDLLYFITSIWCIPYKKGKSGIVRNYRHLLFANHRHTDLIRESVSWYMGKLGIKTDLVLSLSVIVWVLYANGKQQLIEISDKGKGAGSEQPEPFPLIMFENNKCLNLEILAENREGYILNFL